MTNEPPCEQFVSVLRNLRRMIAFAALPFLGIYSMERNSNLWNNVELEIGLSWGIGAANSVCWAESLGSYGTWWNLSF